jgi:hypothetical protein
MVRGLHYNSNYLVVFIDNYFALGSVGQDC